MADIVSFGPPINQREVVTATGAPSGPPTGFAAYKIGDHAKANDGTEWVCTVAGSPGTWVQVGTTVGGITIPKSIYVSFPVYTAGTSTAIPSGFVVPNDGPTWNIVAVSYRYHVAGPAALTFNITNDPSATAVGAGATQITAADLNTIAADTIANATLSGATTLVAGAALSMTISSATQTGLVALQCTVALQRAS